MASEALLNRASAHYSKGDYVASLIDSKTYIRTVEKPSVQAYIIYANSLIKTKAILTE
jgi:outer membrane protein assembly factor BamD (BamD/ComL family)